MPDALFAAKELDAILSNQLPTFHQLATGLLFWRALCQFQACDDLIAARLARMLTFAVAPVSKPSIHHAIVFRVAECGCVSHCRLCADWW